MKKTFLSLFLAIPLFASEATLTEKYSNNHKGDWNLSGTVGAGYGTWTRSFYGHTDLTVLHYLFDKFSVGIATDLSFYGSGHVSLLMGPSVQYDFLQLNKFVFYSRATALAKITSPYIDYVLTGEAGMDYYITPYISIGPTVQLKKYIANDINIPIETTTGGRLSVHF